MRLSLLLEFFNLYTNELAAYCVNIMPRFILSIIVKSNCIFLYTTFYNLRAILKVLKLSSKKESILSIKNAKFI